MIIFLQKDNSFIIDLTTWCINTLKFIECTIEFAIKIS